VRALEERNGQFTSVALVIVDEFDEFARLSRRQIDRLRKHRPQGFPREYWRRDRARRNRQASPTDFRSVSGLAPTTGNEHLQTGGCEQKFVRPCPKWCNRVQGIERQTTFS
jgi:hypothetical protein